MAKAVKPTNEQIVNLLEEILRELDELKESLAHLSKSA